MPAVIELLFLLLPVAAASGWWLARRRAAPAPRAAVPGAHPAFFRGLNYLLDEQPDKAIDVFLELAEVDSETVETHLALGSLFRRRGEADRAIRIHQNLIARTQPQCRAARLRPATNWVRTTCAPGCSIGRSCCLQELAEIGLHRERALRGLLDIYQQERDWAHCLEIAERLKPFSERPLDTEIAQYHCELAEEARRRADPDAARHHLARAQDADPQCVRATMIAGQMALADGDTAGRPGAVPAGRRPGRALCAGGPARADAGPGRPGARRSRSRCWSPWRRGIPRGRSCWP